MSCAPFAAGAVLNRASHAAIGDWCEARVYIETPLNIAPVDLALDGSLRTGDVLATTDGLVAYSGIRVGNDQAPDFAPVASFPGLTPEVRARLNDMKVAPARADMAETR